MENRALWIAFFFTIQFLAVLGENPFKEYFYNKYHHKGHHSSTPEEISSISDNDDTSMTPPTLQFGGGYYYDSSRDAVNAAIIITSITLGCFVFVAVCSCCVYFCVRELRGNKEVRGRILFLNRPETATEVRPQQFAQHQQQPLAVQQFLQPVTNQQYPHGYMQHPPPHAHYQPNPVHQQHFPQTSPAQGQSHNPPSSPPDFPEKFE